MNPAFLVSFGRIIVMSDPSGGFKVKGALLECFLEYPQFREDLPVLIAEGYVKITGPETCEWTKTITSLAEYFKWANPMPGTITGGRWTPISAAFGEKQRSLSKLAGKNANPLKPEYSRDFRKIKPILEKHRAQRLREEKERERFNVIKKLINETDVKKPEEIHKALIKVESFFPKTVDKRPLLRR
jgi:hypothetical protein